MQDRQPQRAAAALDTFLKTPLDQALSRHLEVAPEQRAIELFRSVAESVPAYRAFLSEHGVDPAAVREYADFQALPLLTKQNYLRRHALPDLCRDGALESCDMIAVSSGSTGEPTFWPRFIADEYAIATRFEQVFHDSFMADTRRTLAVVCFALGTWVGGMYTASCCRHLAAKGYPITLITPGNNKDEIFRVVTALGPAFEQVVLLGYPPFLKDVIDTGRTRGVEWSCYNVKLVMAGEVFSEEWRALVGERMGGQNIYCDSASLYGTADAGVLANETPLSVCIRRFLAEKPDAARALFGESRLPTLAQYDPLSRFFEVHDNTLLFTGDNGIPLIRYHIADTGGVIGYDAMLRFLAEQGFDPLAEMGQTIREETRRDAKIENELQNLRVPSGPEGTPFADQPAVRGVRDLPFVYVFGRSHFTISYFGANIYPENVTVGLEQATVKEWVTGKFVMESREDDDRNRYLSIVVELAPGVAGDAEKQQAIGASILAQLRRLNSEFANYTPPEYQFPRVTLLPAGDPEYFPIGVKHRYTRK